jgi:cell division septation protein DedD
MTVIRITLFLLLLISCSTTKQLKTIPKSQVQMADSVAMNQQHLNANQEHVFTPEPVVTFPRGSAYSDELVDKINSKNFEKAALFIAGKIATEYDTLLRWRVQLTALSDRQKAEDEVAQYSAKRPEPTFVVEAAGLYKVQVGNYEFRVKADQLLYDLKKIGITGAWVVQANEFVPKRAAAPQQSKLPKYHVQLGSFSARENAEAFIEKARQLYSGTLLVHEEKSVYKVFAGEAETRESIDKIKRLLGNLGLKGFVISRY